MDLPSQSAASASQLHQAALFELLKGGVPTLDTGTAFRTLTETAALALNVQRASVWLLNDDASQLNLADLYLPGERKHVTGTTLQHDQYPAYFHALISTRAIVAVDAATDPRTREFGPAYLGALNIVSMLDAGIWQDGAARGVVCFEAVGQRRDWTPAEQQFAGSIADLAGAVLAHDSLRRAQVRARESEELFSRAVQASPDWITIVRLTDGKLLHVNAGFERLSGRAAADVIGKTGAEIGLWPDLRERERWLAQVVRDGRVSDFETELMTAAGEVRAVVLSSETVDILGAPCVVSVCRDVTEAKRHERMVFEIAQGVAAETGESFFRSLVAHLARMLNADMAFVGELVEPDRTAVRTIAAHAGAGGIANFSYALHGSPCETIIGRSICAYPCDVWKLFPEDRALADKGIEGYVGAPLMDSAGQPLGLIAVLFKQPVANPALAENLLRIFAARASGEMERRRQMGVLEHLALHDSLTGLPNRVSLTRHVDTQIQAGAAGTLFLIDLDRFKEINDTLGHHLGDELLVAVARRLDSHRFARAALVTRLGGDEFALWVDGLTEGEMAEAMAARIINLVGEPFGIETYRLTLGASVGVAIAPTHAQTCGGLLRCAEVAMYAAKAGGEGFALYEANADPYSAERLRLLSELNEAVHSNQLEVHYQPQLTLHDNKVSGFEALVRWRHPRLGLLPPARFIPLAELSDVIRPLTLQVLKTALTQQRLWRESGRHVRLAVNISARHLLDESCPEQIERLLKETQAVPDMLKIEITESALIADPERAEATVRRIRDLGVQVAIDDFGTGYSSLSHLKRLPLSALKIDLSFVRQMLQNVQDRVIVESTIGLAKNLGLTVIAEGIEDAATLQALSDCGCDEGQGYFISRPMAAAEATAWLNAGVALA